MLIQQSVIVVADASQVGEARRAMAQLSRWAGLDETAAGRAAIITSELAANVVRHARQGEIVVSAYLAEGLSAVEVTAVDRGPGMSDVAKCLRDGFSSGGTAGTGLGAVQRLSTEFDIYSHPAQGTVVFARLMPGKSPTPGPFQWGAAGRPMTPGTQSGDCWRIAERGGRFAAMVADGLGHGPEAATAADQAAAVFDSHPFDGGLYFMEQAHTRMRGSRGAAVATALIDIESGDIGYTGVGNIAGYLEALRGERANQGLVSHNGIVGVNQRKVTQFNYACPAHGLLIMHSDGLRSRWSLDEYPGLALRHPALIAAVLCRDFSRGRDDVTVLAIRISRGVFNGSHN